MCKANDIYIPVLVGHEIVQRITEPLPEEPTDDPVLNNDDEEEEEDDARWDAFSWIIFLGGILLLSMIATMPCSCTIVDGIEKQGSSLLRGATKLAEHFRPDRDSLTRIFVTRDDTETPLLRASSLQPLSSESSSSSSSIDSTEATVSLESFETLNVNSGSDDGFVHQEENVDVDEFGSSHEKDIADSMTTRRSIVHKMKARRNRDPSNEDSPRDIFTPSYLDHVFVSHSGSDDDAEPQVDERESTSMSHEIQDTDDGSDRARPSYQEEKGSPQSYSISYDEVFYASHSDDDSEAIDEPVIARRKLAVSTP